jgi:hypothetical protein
MSKATKWLMIISTSIFSFAMAMTMPTVQLYFLQRVDPQVYAASSMLGTGIAAIMQSLMSDSKIRFIMRRIFAVVLLFDAVGYATISLISIDNVTIRFIGIEVLSAITMGIWMTIMLDAINGVLSGTLLTDFQTLTQSVRLWATLAGSLVAILATGLISLEHAIWLQCGANALFSMCDYKSYTNLTKGVS